MTSSAPAPAVNVEGYLDTCAGQGEAARLYLRALHAAGVPLTATVVSVEDVAPGIPATTFPKKRVDLEALTSGADPNVNLICVNGLELQAFAAAKPPRYFSDRRCVGVWAWETDRVPGAMSEAAGLLEEVWVYSRYVADNLAPAVGVPVVPVALPVIAPEPPSHRIGIDLPDGFSFLFAFDFFSTLGRKNPLGAVAAFSRAFEPGEGPQLVLKTVNGAAQPNALEQVRGAIADRPDIHIVDRVMDDDEKAALFARCDCYVSLHRSEGFGLPIAEFMALGKPAIATAYSGNREFMTRENSYLVDYEITAVGSGNDVYPAEGSWAEPAVEHAAELMRRVWENPDEARAVGERARADLQGSLSPQAVGARARERLEALLRMPRRTLAVASPSSRGPSVAGAGPDRVAELARLVALDPSVGDPARPGPIRRLARRALLRLMGPFTAYQHAVDEAIVAELREIRGELDARATPAHQDAAPQPPPAPKPPRAAPPRASSRKDNPGAGSISDAADSVDVWFHSIDLGDRVVTPGLKAPDQLADELASLRLPDVSGKTVLDVGAWDGFYSFEAERRGAARVVALDHYAWSVDLAEWQRYLAGCRSNGVTPRPADQVPDVWRPEELPGKRGFDVARDALGSAVEPVVDDFMDMDLSPLGTFDVVLFLGVLYHLKNPLGALERLATVTRQVAIIESEADVIPGLDDHALCRFLEADERAGDPGNWWSPNLTALVAMCRSAGFGRVEPVAGPPAELAADEPGVHRYRAVVHAWK